AHSASPAADANTVARPAPVPVARRTGAFRRPGPGGRPERIPQPCGRPPRPAAPRWSRMAPPRTGPAGEIGETVRRSGRRRVVRRCSVPGPSRGLDRRLEGRAPPGRLTGAVICGAGPAGEAARGYGGLAGRCPPRRGGAV